MPGLTTNEAPFIEQARREGQLYIHQPYELYSEENHEAWRRLYSRLLPRWERYANEHFLAGIEESRVSHHHHHSPLGPARLPARTRYFPRHRGARADAYGPQLRRGAGAVRRVRAHCSEPGGGHSRPAGARPGAYQCLPRDGALLLV